MRLFISCMAEDYVEKAKEWAVINVSGKDRQGIISDISGVLAQNDVNIIDIGHTVIHKMFSMFMIVDIYQSSVSYRELKGVLCGLGEKLSFDIEVNRLEDGRDVKSGTSKSEDRYVLSVLARDRVGMVYDISRCLSDEGVNILRVALVARGKLITIEMLVDIDGKSADDVRRVLRGKGGSFGLDIVFLREDVFKREKRLVVFDMDSTIVDAEVIDEVAKRAGIDCEVKALTRQAMDGEIDFKESLRRRVKLLFGLSESVLKDVYDNLRLTPGACELVRALKVQGYNVALVSGGFTYFTDRLNDVLHFDHVYANKLVIKNGKVMGDIEGDIIDERRKGEIIDELMREYGLAREQVVAVGDGANDRQMLQNAGLGIAFNAKDALKKVSSGSISKENLVGILDVLGIKD